MLKPACIHNPRPGAYVLVIENNSTGEILGHVSEVNPVEAEQHIVRLRHGAGIIAEAAAPAQPGCRTGNPHEDPRACRRRRGTGTTT